MSNSVQTFLGNCFCGTLLGMCLIEGVLMEVEVSWSIHWTHLEVLRAATWKQSRDLKEDDLESGNGTRWVSQIAFDCFLQDKSQRQEAVAHWAPWKTHLSAHALQSMPVKTAEWAFAQSCSHIAIEKHSYCWSSLDVRVVWKDLSSECCQLLQTSSTEILTWAINPYHSH